MAAPAPRNSSLDVVSRGTLATIQTLLNTRIGEAGATLRGAVAGAISLSIRILRDAGIVNANRSLAAAVVSALRSRTQSAAAYARELAGGRTEAVIPYTPGLQPGEFRGVAEVQVGPIRDFAGGTVRLAVRQMGIPQTTEELHAALESALADFVAEYEIENIARHVVPDSLRIISVESGG